jgi:TIGR03009 family protein
MPRPNPNLILGLAAVLAMGFGPASPQQGSSPPRSTRGQVRAGAPEPGGNLDKREKTEVLLAKWERQSSLLKTLEASIYRIDKTPGFDEDHFEGRAAFRTPNQAFLDFGRVKTKLVPDPKDQAGKKRKVVAQVDPKTNRRISVPYETILCTGKEVWHYRSDVMQLFIYTLDRDQQRRALEEGPLPFLFNMKAAEAHRRYDMVLQAEDSDVHFLVVTPRLKQDQETFTKAWVFLNRKYLLPVRILLFAPDGKSTQDYYFSNIRANKPVKEEYFRGVVPPKPWKVERNPTGDGPARGVRGADRRRDDGGPAPRRAAGLSPGQPR